MNVPFLDLKAQYNTIAKEAQERLVEVMENTAFASGPFVKSFENNFAELHEVKHCLGVNSGTSALHLALLALGIGEGDEVIIPSHTFVSTAWAVSYVNATPVFVDVDDKTYTIDPKLIERKITDKTKAIIPVHLYGMPADMEAINIIAENYNLHVIEDAAQAHLAEYKMKKVGNFSDVACFSFYPGKNLGAFGEGGACLTNNEELADKISLLRNHAQPQKYIHTEIGYNYRMDGFQGAILDLKLKYIDKWTNRRIEISQKYSNGLLNLSEVKTPLVPKNRKCVFHLYELKLKDQQTRDSLKQYLLDNEIHCGLHYPIPVHLQKAYEHLNYKMGDFKITEELADTLLSLPIYPEMTDDMIEYVISKIKEYFN